MRGPHTETTVPAVRAVPAIFVATLLYRFFLVSNQPCDATSAPAPSRAVVLWLVLLGEAALETAPHSWVYAEAQTKTWPFGFTFSAEVMQKQLIAFAEHGDSRYCLRQWVRNGLGADQCSQVLCSTTPEQLAVFSFKSADKVFTICAERIGFAVELRDSCVRTRRFSSRSCGCWWAISSSLTSSAVAAELAAKQWQDLFHCAVFSGSPYLARTSFRTSP